MKILCINACIGEKIKVTAVKENRYSKVRLDLIGSSKQIPNIRFTNPITKEYQKE